MQPIKYSSAIVDRCEAILKEGDGMIIVQTAREGQYVYTKLYKGVYKNTLMYFARDEFWLVRALEFKPNFVCSFSNIIVGEMNIFGKLNSPAMERGDLVIEGLEASGRLADMPLAVRS